MVGVQPAPKPCFSSNRDLRMRHSSKVTFAARWIRIAANIGSSPPVSSGAATAVARGAAVAAVTTIFMGANSPSDVSAGRDLNSRGLMIWKQGKVPSGNRRRELSCEGSDLPACRPLCGAMRLHPAWDGQHQALRRVRLRGFGGNSEPAYITRYGASISLFRDFQPFGERKGRTLMIQGRSRHQCRESCYALVR